MFLWELVKDIKGDPAFTFYVQLDYNPESGQKKSRVTRVPTDDMYAFQKPLQWYFSEDMQEKVSRYATGCWPGSSHEGNAARHLSGRYFYLLDLESAYPTLSAKMASTVLCKLDKKLADQNEEVAAFLDRYCFLGKEMIAACRRAGANIDLNDKLMSKQVGGLITGGLVSPFLFDLVVGNLIDYKIAKVLREFVGKGWTYTRFVDDLTISFDNHDVRRDPCLRREIRRVIQKAGFEISHHKSKVLDIQKGAVAVTGVQLVAGKSGNYIKLSRSYLENMRHEFYLANKEGSNINPRRISGLWGALIASMKHRKTPPSSLEKDIARLYRAFHQKYYPKPTPEEIRERRLRKRLSEINLSRPMPPPVMPVLLDPTNPQQLMLFRL